MDERFINYRDLSEEKISNLESETPSALASAGLLILFGYQRGILPLDETIKAVHNLFVATLVVGE